MIALALPFLFLLALCAVGAWGENTKTGTRCFNWIHRVVLGGDGE